ATPPTRHHPTPAQPTRCATGCEPKPARKATPNAPPPSNPSSATRNTTEALPPSNAVARPPPTTSGNSSTPPPTCAPCTATPAISGTGRYTRPSPTTNTKG